MRRRDRNQQNHRSYNFVDTNLTWDTATGNVGHKVMVGFNGGEEKTAHFTRVNFDNNNATLDIDIYNPVYGQGVPNVDRHVGDNDRFEELQVVGLLRPGPTDVYGQLEGVVAARDEKFDTDQTLYQPEFPTPVYKSTQTASNHDASKMAGIIYQPNELVDLYQLRPILYAADVGQGRCQRQPGDIAGRGVYRGGIQGRLPDGYGDRLRLYDQT